MLRRTRITVKKTFSVALIISMMILSLMPAFAADVQLTDGNIAEYPTIEGEIYFTQKVGDCLTLTGGKVTTDCTAEGEEIPGHFEFLDPNFTPTSTVTAQRASIKFIPENEDLYSTIEVKNSRNLRFYAKEAPMVLEDSSELVTAVLDEPGALSNAKINEVPVICTLSGETVVGAKWNWNVSAQVEKNGFYEARITKTGYTPFVVDVYVKVAGDESEPSVKKFPTIEPTTWYEGLTAGDLKLEGGEKTVPGDFAISEPDRVLNAGAYYLKIIFTPKDESQQSISKIIPVTILQADASFIDENGDITVPELTWTLGTKYYLTNLLSQLEKMKANCGTFKVGAITIDGIQPDGSIFVANEYKVDGYTATATLKSQENTNYTNTLKFKIVIEKNKINPDIQSQGNNMFAVVDRNIFSSATLTGRFTVEVQGEKGEYAQTITDVKLNVPFEYHPGKSGKYTFTITYDDKNDEKYELPEPVEVSKDIVLSWTVTGKNVHFESRQATYGEEVMVDAAITNDKFGGWKFYDENGKEIKDFNYTETSQNLRITFVMPDYPITVEAVDKTQSGISGGGNFSDFFSNFVKWLNNLAAKLKALFDAIAQLLTVVG